jgi:hypothetical protein
LVKTASGSGKMKGDLHRMTHFFSLRQAPLQQRTCYYLAENELAKILTVATPRLSTRCFWPRKLIDTASKPTHESQF